MQSTSSTYNINCGAFLTDFRCHIMDTNDQLKIKSCINDKHNIIKYPKYVIWLQNC